MCKTKFFTRTQEPYAFLLEKREWKSKRNRILTRDKHTCKKCGADGNEFSLHVHHKHYIYGLDPWEYKDSELLTLCEQCHSELHNTEHVPMFTLVDGELQEIELTPCSRCSGAGEFPEYRHVQGGICFRCHGSRFDEFIVSTEDYAKEHNIDLSEYEDGFRTLSPEFCSQIKDIIVLKSPFWRNELYVRINLINNKYINAHLDYSVTAKHGDRIDVNGIRCKEGFSESNGKSYFIIKGDILKGN